MQDLTLNIKIMQDGKIFSDTTRLADRRSREAILAMTVPEQMGEWLWNTYTMYTAFQIFPHGVSSSGLEEIGYIIS